MSQNYILQVTAGSEYDITTHQIVPVNEAKTIRIDNEHITADLNVRIQSYRGLPRASPTTSPYFDLPPHAKSKDQYSIAFRFTPKANINGDDLVFGNDFDHPIRDRLPPGFGTAFKIVKWAVDPGLDGDVYADKPYLYGPAGSSVNALYVGSKGQHGGAKVGEHDAGLVFEEGGDEEGVKVREEHHIPAGDAGRKKWFLDQNKRKGWEWEEGRTYGCDFYNPYLDFNDFALRLPGFTLPIMKYWDGQGLRKVQKRSHTLRYTLKNRATDTVLFVVLFTLYLKEDVDEATGELKEGVEGGKPFALLPQAQREKHEKEIEGVEEHGEEGKGHAEGGEKKAESQKQFVDDDVD